MRSFEELFKESSSLHNHHCAGQVLGVRMAMVGCREVGIDEPKGCKKLVVYVEMYRCATDAVQAVTGCSLGKRTLKFLDYGKMAATFVNTETQQAIRVLAKDDARALAPRYVQDRANPREGQKQAYRIMPEDSLFSVTPVSLRVPAQEMPGYRASGCNARNVVRASIITAKCGGVAGLCVSLAPKADSCRIPSLKGPLKSCWSSAT